MLRFPICGFGKELFEVYRKFKQSRPACRRGLGESQSSISHEKKLNLENYLPFAAITEIGANARLLLLVLRRLTKSANHVLRYIMLS